MGRMTGSSTLASTLRAVMSGLEHAYGEEGAGRPPFPSLDMWANLLRVVPPAGIDRREFPAMVRLSKRAVRTRVSTAVRQSPIGPH